MKTKYVCVDNGINEVIVAFPEFIEHSAVRLPGTVVSAGFIEVDPEAGRYRCYGESHSLGLQAREVDSLFANKQLP